MPPIPDFLKRDKDNRLMNAPAPQAPNPLMSLTMDQLVDQYVRLRDRLKEADEKHNEKMKPAKDYLQSLNGALMAQLQQMGMDSAKTIHGTAYMSERKSATVGDADAFRNYVIEHGEFDLADWRANATAVADYAGEHQGQLPPGVNYSTVLTVGVRRA